MLRIALIALVAINLLLFILEASKAPSVEEPVAAPGNPSLLEPGLPGIPLLSELDGDGGQGGVAGKCFTLGPFETAEAQAAARAALAPLAEPVTGRRTAEQMERGFWVFIPSFESAQEARAAAQRMRAAGIGDVDVIRNGRYDNSISLGFFLNETNAVAREEFVREAGFDARIRAQQSAEDRYWLDYEQPVGSRFAAHSLSDLFPPAMHRPIPCVSAGPPEDRMPYSAE